MPSLVRVWVWFFRLCWSVIERRDESDREQGGKTRILLWRIDETAVQVGSYPKKPLWDRLDSSSFH